MCIHKVIFMPKIAQTFTFDRCKCIDTSLNSLSEIEKKNLSRHGLNCGDKNIGKFSYKSQNLLSVSSLICGLRESTFYVPNFTTFRDAET